MKAARSNTVSPGSREMKAARSNTVPPGSREMKAARSNTVSPGSREIKYARKFYHRDISSSHGGEYELQMSSGMYCRVK
jgi:hypothetical protein